MSQLNTIEALRSSHAEITTFALALGITRAQSAITGATITASRTRQGRRCWRKKDVDKQKWLLSAGSLLRSCLKNHTCHVARCNLTLLRLNSLLGRQVGLQLVLASFKCLKMGYSTGDVCSAVISMDGFQVDSKSVTLSRKITSPTQLSLLTARLYVMMVPDTLAEDTASYCMGSDISDNVPLDHSLHLWISPLDKTQMTPFGSGPMASCARLAGAQSFCTQLHGGLASNAICSASNVMALYHHVLSKMRFSLVVRKTIWTPGAWS